MLDLEMKNVAMCGYKGYYSAVMMSLGRDWL